MYACSPLRQQPCQSILNANYIECKAALRVSRIPAFYKEEKQHGMTPSWSGLHPGGFIAMDIATKSAIRIPPRINVLGVGVHATNMDEAVQIVLETVRNNDKGFVCVRDVHGIMGSQTDESLRTIHNHSLLTVPDGMPTVWIGRMLGHRAMRRVYGPDFMARVCQDTADSNITHFLYGGNPDVAETLRDELTQRFPGLKIVGTYTPPFRPLNEDEERELANLIDTCRPDIFWVGFSTPKQERFMSKYLPTLPVHVMVGVGAAFDIHTGRTKDAPDWVKALGMQWFYRLTNEPRRLWKRYAYVVPGFLLLAFLQWTGLRPCRL